MPDLPKTTIRIITALLKHQATLVFGETASKEIADTLIGEDLQKRLDDWLEADQNAKQLLEAAEQAHHYVQDPHNCPDAELRQVFHGMRFDNLQSVQAALTELPQALDAGKLQETLQQAFTRDLPNLTPTQHKEGARIYSDALLRSVGKLEKFVSPILIQLARLSSPCNSHGSTDTSSPACIGSAPSKRMRLTHPLHYVDSTWAWTCRRM